ncbi:PqqD family protein [Marinilabiliaceae bacterium ANBcel2]|nr:PqqD family protein [Marinilabiliaceae bacterium ANBcel2]
MIDLNHVFRVKKSNFVTRKVDDEMVLVPLADSVADMTRVLTLNETGTLILENLDGKKDIRQIVNLLLKEYDVDREELEKDIEQFIFEAKEKGIVEQIP